MARYIDADKTKFFIADVFDRFDVPIYDKVANAVYKQIDSMPTADVEEVKHGEWYLIDECSNEGVYCSVCHKKVYKMCYGNGNVKVKSKYCPNCGAKMKGKEKEV